MLGIALSVNGRFGKLDASQPMIGTKVVTVHPSSLETMLYRFAVLAIPILPRRCTCALLALILAICATTLCGRENKELLVQGFAPAGEPGSGYAPSQTTLSNAARSLTESPLSQSELDYLQANVVESEGEILQPEGQAVEGPQVVTPPQTENRFIEAHQEPWSLQLMPKGLIYRSYMAGVKESGFRSVWNHDENLGWIWDISLGGRAGILRWGTPGGYFPQGWQLDIEGASLLRLDPEDQRDLVAADFRFGIPLTYGRGRWQTKFAYYHLSSHLGDEYMLKHPLDPRINYAGDSMVLGFSYYPVEYWRWYAEGAYAFFRDIKEPWEFQFGFDVSPYWSRGLRGSPFFAMNGLIRQEVNYGGHWVVQGGWQWRGKPGSGIFRMGVQYYNGMSELFEFHNRFENKVGIGLWYDF